MQVAVSPIRNAAGEVIGGVETFRDMSAVLADLERAKRIQTLALEHDLPADAHAKDSPPSTCRMTSSVGDFYAIRQLDADRYGFLVADVMGHGVAAALYTMYLSSLWDRDYRLVASPADFAAAVNNDLAKVVKDESFATALCGVLDARQRPCGSLPRAVRRCSSCTPAAPPSRCNPPACPSG